MADTNEVLRFPLPSNGRAVKRTQLKEWVRDNAQRDDDGNLVGGQVMRHPDGVTTVTVRSHDDGLELLEMCKWCESVQKPSSMERHFHTCSKYSSVFGNSLADPVAESSIGAAATSASAGSAQQVEVAPTTVTKTPKGTNNKKELRGDKTKKDAGAENKRSQTTAADTAAKKNRKNTTAAEVEDTAVQPKKSNRIKNRTAKNRDK